MVLGNAGAAVVIEQKDVTDDKMIAEIERLYNDSGRIEVMSQSAAGLCITDTNERILGVIRKLYAKSEK